MDSRPERNHGNVVTGGPGQARWQLVDWTAPRLCVDKLGGTTGERDRSRNPRLQHRQNKASDLLAVKTCGGCGGRRKCKYLESRAQARQVALFPL